MKIQHAIEQKLRANFVTRWLQINNESHMHGGSTHPESHFKIHIVSDDFINKPLLARHRMVQKALEEEMAQTKAIHLVTQTVAEWQKTVAEDSALKSPACHNQ